MSVKITAEFANYDAAEIAARAVRKHCSGVTRIVLRDNSVGRWSDEYHIGAYPGYRRETSVEMEVADESTGEVESYLINSGGLHVKAH